MGLNEMMKRRQFFKGGVVTGALAGITGVSAEELVKTPKQIEGPFYPKVAQKDKDFDLTKIEGQEGTAAGKVVIISGAILNTDGTPVEDATVDLWQANAAGRYNHPSDKNEAPLDPNFQGWAIVPSGKNGEFKFKTVIPGSYPASKDWSRPPHIHFKVSKLGYVELITQMYFPGEKLNDTDKLLQRVPEAERTALIAKLIPGEIDTYEFKIVLEKA
ncbi:MAG: protocatechuate 3,4-dioxygenase [Akkermansiaceae bacterium]|jgi:protocatechuate 3,4-dioxygenase beta subunit